MYWLCCERYRGSGRISRTWIEEGDVSPDTPEPCTGQYPACENDRAPWSHAQTHIAYPFNGMGGEVVGGFETREAAEGAEADLE